MLWTRVWRRSIATDRIILSEDLEVQVERRAVKRINLYVRPPYGEVFVTCPKRVSKRELMAVLRDKEDWLRQSRERIQAKHAHSVAVQEALESGGGLDGEEVLFLGGRWPVATLPGPRLDYAVDEDLHRITLYVPERILSGDDAGRASDAQVALLKRLYKETLAEALPSYLSKWESKLGVRAEKVTFRAMTSRWGSCQVRDRRLSFNTHLAKYDLKYFESVVLHELVHLRVPNHGPDFYRLMDLYLPEWQALRRELKQMPH